MMFIRVLSAIIVLFNLLSRFGQKVGLSRELNPGPLAPEARIIPLDQRASEVLVASVTMCISTTGGRAAAGAVVGAA